MVLREGLTGVRTSEQKFEGGKEISLADYLSGVRRFQSTKAAMQECDVPGVLIVFKV